MIILGWKTFFSMHLPFIMHKRVPSSTNADSAARAYLVTAAAMELCLVLLLMASGFCSYRPLRALSSGFVKSYTKYYHVFLLLLVKNVLNGFLCYLLNVTLCIIAIQDISEFFFYHLHLMF